MIAAAEQGHDENEEDEEEEEEEIAPATPIPRIRTRRTAARLKTVTTAPRSRRRRGGSSQSAPRAGECDSRARINDSLFANRAHGFRKSAHQIVFARGELGLSQFRL